MSLESRLQELEHALAARQPPKVVEIQCIVCCSRAEVLAIEKYQAEHPEPPRPPAPGRVRLVQLPAVSAAEYLRARGVEPPTTENDRVSSTAE